MTTYGLTPTGFVAPTANELIERMKTKARAVIDPDLVLDSDDPLGETIGIVGAELGEAWAALQGVNANLDPDSNEGVGQEQVAAITGTFREGAEFSVVMATVNVAPGTYPAGTLIARSSVDITARFRNRDDVTNGGVAAATLPAVFQAEQTGPVRCDASKLTVKVAAVSGWNTVNNATDAVVGRDVETDDELRERRDQELAAAGGSTLDAMRVDLLEIDGVEAVVPIENEDDVTDPVTGLPPHSFEMVVYDGSIDGSIVADTTIAQAIWKTKPSGIKSYGSTTALAVDSLGNPRLVRFSRPTILTAYLTIELSVSVADGWVPSASPDLVKSAVAAFVDKHQKIGASLILATLYGPILGGSGCPGIPGVTDIVRIRAGFAPVPTLSVNLPAGLRDLIDVDTSRITVTV